MKQIIIQPNSGEYNISNLLNALISLSKSFMNKDQVVRFNSIDKDPYGSLSGEELLGQFMASKNIQYSELSPQEVRLLNLTSKLLKCFALSGGENTALGLALIQYPEVINNLPLIFSSGFCKDFIVYLYTLRHANHHKSAIEARRLNYETIVASYGLPVVVQALQSLVKYTPQLIEHLQGNPSLRNMFGDQFNPSEHVNFDTFNFSVSEIEFYIRYLNQINDLVINIIPVLQST